MIPEDPATRCNSLDFRSLKLGGLVSGGQRVLFRERREHHGRIDSQVKIRGFRIELGEIEQAMLEIPGITSSVAIVVPDTAGQPSLCGYFVASDDVTPDRVER